MSDADSFLSKDCSQLDEIRQDLVNCYKKAGFVGKMLGECSALNKYYTKCIRKNYETKRMKNNEEGQVLKKRYERALKDQVDNDKNDLFKRKE